MCLIFRERNPSDDFKRQLDNIKVFAGSRGLVLEFSGDMEWGTIDRRLNGGTLVASVNQSNVLLSSTTHQPEHRLKNYD